MTDLTRRHALFAVAAPALLGALPAFAQTPTDPEDGVLAPEIEAATGDYAAARRRFRTTLTQHRAAPGPKAIDPTAAGVTRIAYASNGRDLAAWFQAPAGGGRHPAVLFLHGGFAFGLADWEMAQPFRDAGFAVMLPLLRGENGQAGDFTLFYDEVDDVLAAAKRLRAMPNVDPRRIFIAGHSVGGTLALLATMAQRGFRGAASFSGSPDQVLYTRYGIRPTDIPFDVKDRRELQMRSPMSWAASLKAPTRLYFGTGEPHWKLSTLRTVEIARAQRLDVESKRIEGGHESAVPAEMAEAIAFFRRLGARA